jgi:hypothetical protein
MQANLINSIETCGRTLLDTIDHLLDYTKINRSTTVSREEKNSRREAREHGITPIKTKRMDTPAKTANEVDICAVTEEVLNAVSAGYDIHRLAASRNSTGRRPLDSSYADDTSGDSGAPHTDNSHLNNVAVSIDIANNANWKFRTEAGAWRRVVMNIYSNSLKYTEKGFIKVSLRADPLPPRHGFDRSMVVLKITDSGRGMSKTYLQEKLFTPFAQEDQLAPGTGLGLSIIQNIIKHMGGKIEVRSSTATVGHGTEISVSIPMTHASSVDIPRSLDSDHLNSIVKMTEGMDVCLSAVLSGRSEEMRSSNTPNHELLALQHMCESWYHMRVQTKTYSPKLPDVYVILENEVNHHSLRNGSLIAALQQKAATHHSQQPLRVIVICRTPSSTSTLERSSGKIDGQNFIEFVCQPCGPQKLGKTLKRCFATRGQVKPTSMQSGTVDGYFAPPPQNDTGESESQPAARRGSLPPSPPSEAYSLASPLNGPSTAVLLNDAEPFLLVDDNHINVQVCSISPLTFVVFNTDVLLQ